MVSISCGMRLQYVCIRHYKINDIVATFPIVRFVEIHAEYSKQVVPSTREPWKIHENCKCIKTPVPPHIIRVSTSSMHVDD